MLGHLWSSLSHLCQRGLADWLLRQQTQNTQGLHKPLSWPRHGSDPSCTLPSQGSTFPRSLTWLVEPEETEGQYQSPGHCRRDPVTPPPPRRKPVPAGHMGQHRCWMLREMALHKAVPSLSSQTGIQRCENELSCPWAHSHYTRETRTPALLSLCVPSVSGPMVTTQWFCQRFRSSQYRNTTPEHLH